MRFSERAIDLARLIGPIEVGRDERAMRTRRAFGNGEIRNLSEL